MLDILSKEDKYHLSLKILMAKLEQYNIENVRYHQKYQNLHWEDTSLKFVYYGGRGVLNFRVNFCPGLARGTISKFWVQN